MSKSFEIETLGNPSIYEDGIENKQSRKLKIYGAFPETGVNEDTGIVLFIAGFGGHANSGVYKKMRSLFSDQHNLVAIQCDYFGWEFMQNALAFKEIDKLSFSYIENFKELSNSEINLQIQQDESIANFCDMSFMQAIDNIAAVLHIVNVFTQKGIVLNLKKIILYGHSHGAYLSHLCNVFAPKLFSYLIDNSAWLFPHYCFVDRILSIPSLYKNQRGDNITFKIKFLFFAKDFFKEKDLIVHLSTVYQHVVNNCPMMVYHGITDEMTECLEKESLCKSIPLCSFNLITQECVDGVIFKSTSHGLDADFLELFNWAISNKSTPFRKNSKLELDTEIIWQNDTYKYIFDYKRIIPLLKRVKKIES